MNVRGIRKVQLNSGPGPTTFHRWMRTQASGIIALQELQLDPTTFPDNDQLNRLKTALGTHDAIWTPFCALLLTDTDLSFTSHSTSTDLRSITASILSSRTHETITVCCVYAPAQHRLRTPFFESLLQQPFFSNPSPHSILLGDLNMNHYGQPTRYQDFQDWIRSNMVDGMIEDRRTPLTTFTSPGHGVSTTIDYIFVTADLSNRTSHPTHTYPTTFSDHDLLSISLHPSSQYRPGRGCWRLNNSILQHPDFPGYLNTALDRFTRPSPRESCSQHWDRVKKKVKYICITFSRQYNTSKTSRIQTLQTRRTELKDQEADAVAQNDPLAQIYRDEIAEVEEELDSLTEAQLRGLALRAGIKWLEEGERSTQYFFRTIQQRRQKRTIPPLYDSASNSLVPEPEGMCNIARTFYRQLYTPDPTDPVAATTLLASLSMRPKISEDDNTTLLSHITQFDLQAIIEHSPRGRAPGDDGLPFELYDLLLRHQPTASLVTAVMNEALEGSFPESWLRTIMVLLYKNKGALEQLSNWRPLSLINCDAKIFTKVLTLRLRPLLSRLITPFQTGFIRKRSIADNALILSGAMDHCKAQRGQQVGVLFDQEKAYDRIHPDYLSNVLTTFGFHPTFVRVISSLLYQTDITLNINGHLATPFRQGRGVRQGDPISPLLFNLAFEPLLQCILQDQRLAGCRLPDPVAEIKLLAFADDLLTFLNNAIEWDALREHLDRYGQASNARVNYSKTVAFPLGWTPDTTLATALSTHNIRWHDPTSDTFITYLGFPVPTGEAHVKLFFDHLLDKITNGLRIHSQRSLSVLGRGTIVNALALSKLWHVLWVFQPTAAWHNRLRQVVCAFMCPFKPAASWETICTPRQQGGLGVIDPVTQTLTFQLKHLLLMTEAEPSIGRSCLGALLHQYTAQVHPLTSILVPGTSAAKDAGKKIRSLQVLLRAAATLPRISIEGSLHAPTGLPPLATLLATPVRWWLEDTGQYIPQVLPTTMGEILRVNDTSRRLEYRPDIGDNTIFIAFCLRFPAPLSETIQDAMRNPIVQDGDDLRQRIRSIPLPDPSNPVAPAPTLFDASTKELRRFLRPVVDPTKLHGSPAEWRRFWRASIPHTARTVWWRALHGKLATAQFRFEKWKIGDSPACPLCDAPTEDIPHMLFLCPTKREAWWTYLREYTIKQDWPDATLTQLLDLSSQSVIPRQDTNITAAQIIAGGLLGIWRTHYAFTIDGIEANTTAFGAAMRKQAQLTIAQNKAK